MTQTKYLIYALQDPQTFEIRYIGKSANGLHRPKAHVQPSYLSKDDTYKGRWIKQLLNNGFKPVIKVIQYLNNPLECIQAEIYWIDYFEKQGCPLTNSTKGGIGSLGYFKSDKTKKKMSIARKKYLKKHPMPTGKDHNRYGVKRTQEEKRLISERTKEQMNNPLVKAKLSMHPNRKAIIDNFGNEYLSLYDAWRKTGISRDSIRDILNGKKISVKGYSFKEIN